MTARFKLIFIGTCLLLYITGALYAVFDNFVHVQGDFGDRHPLQFPTLHLHGIVSLLFFILFGYLFATHILPGLRGRRRRTSGWIVLGLIGILCATVPGLYYLTSESAKNVVAVIHTTLGLLAVVPFIIHMGLRKSLGPA